MQTILIYYFDRRECNWLNCLGVAILHSCQKGDSKFLSALLEGGESPDAIVREDFGRTSSRTTAFQYTIQMEDLRIIKKLVKAGASMNLPPQLGVLRTPPRYAVEIGNREIAQYLIDIGADAHTPPAPYGGATALQPQGFIDIASLLLDRGADINAPAAMYEGRTALEGAVEHRRLEMMHFLV